MAKQMAISVAKASDKTSIEHNNRSMSESELKKLTHIDQNRLDQNEYLVNIPIEQVYEIEFAEALGNYNAKQKGLTGKLIVTTIILCNQKNTCFNKRLFSR